MSVAEQTLKTETKPVRKAGIQHWLMKKAQSAWGPYIMALVAFAESSFFPLPPDLMLIPMIVADRTKAFYLAAICSISSILGGIGGYLLGYYLIDSVGQVIINTYGLETEFLKFQQAFQDYGFWLIIFKGLTPIPFKLVTIASGATQLNFWMFIVAAAISRSIRFFMLATVLWFYGDEAKELYDKHFKSFIIISIGVVIGGFALLKLFK